MRPAPAGGPHAWKVPSLEPGWRHRLCDLETDEIRLAVGVLSTAGTDPVRMSRASFPLPALGERLRAIAAEVRHGRGFAVIEGIPVDSDDDRALEILSHGLGLWLGSGLVGQSHTENPFVQHIRDTGAAGGNQGRTAIGPHADVCDCLALLCHRSPLGGGATGLSSVATVHDEMLERDPAAFATMYEPFDYGPCHVCGRRLELTGFSRSGHELHGRGVPSRRGRGPEPSAKQRHAAELFGAIASEPDVQLRLRLVSGELVLIDNTRVLHARDAFVDGEPFRRRHLLRVLPQPERPPRLAPDFDWRCGGEMHDWDLPRPGVTLGLRPFLPSEG